MNLWTNVLSNIFLKPQLTKITAAFFQLFNFKMKIFPILGHLQYKSDQEYKKFSFWSEIVKEIQQ